MSRSDDERRAVGLALASDRYAETILTHITAEDLVQPGPAEALAAISTLTDEGARVSPQTVGARCTVPVETLVAWNVEALEADGFYRSSDDVAVLCGRLAEATQRQRLGRIASGIADGVSRETPPAEIIERANLDLHDLDVDTRGDPPPDVDSWLDAAPDREWIVEGLVARLDRMLLVAGEGLGKSTLLRQVAMMLSQGIHPWWTTPVPPCRVLLVDLENPPTIARRQISALRASAIAHAHAAAGVPTLDGGPAPFAEYDPDRLRIEMRPEGIDVTHRPDARWLLRKVAAARPDLVVIGPVYKLHESEEEKSSDVRQVLKVLDRIRTRFNCALWMETHAPHESFRQRGELRPAGSRLWLRWPEFVLTLAPRTPAAEGDGEWLVGHARPPRDQRVWPRAMTRGGSSWPWEAERL